MNIKSKIFLVASALVASLGLAFVTAPAANATPVNDGTFGKTKYVYFDSNHRFGAYAQFSYDTTSTGNRITRGYYLSSWTDVKQSDGSWSRVRLCAGQDLTYRYSVRKSDGNHPSPMDWQKTAANISYSNFSIPPVNPTWYQINPYTVTLHAGYIGEGSCLYPYNVDKSISFSATEY